MMTLGALVFTFIGYADGAGVWNGSNPFQAFQQPAHHPELVRRGLPVFTIVQLFGINSLDLYSSGVTLQALGLRLKRYQAVLLDSVICLGITFYAVFNSSFSAYLKDFVTLVIIWIAPWCAIYLVDWAMRRYRYAPAELQKTDHSSIYWSIGGINWSAIAAQAARDGRRDLRDQHRQRLQHPGLAAPDHGRHRGGLGRSARSPAQTSASSWA